MSFDPPPGWLCCYCGKHHPWNHPFWDHWSLRQRGTAPGYIVTTALPAAVAFRTFQDRWGHVEER